MLRRGKIYHGYTRIYKDVRIIQFFPSAIHYNIERISYLSPGREWVLCHPGVRLLGGWLRGMDGLQYLPVWGSSAGRMFWQFWEDRQGTSRNLT